MPVGLRLVTLLTAGLAAAAMHANLLVQFDFDAAVYSNRRWIIVTNRVDLR